MEEKRITGGYCSSSSKRWLLLLGAVGIVLTIIGYNNDGTSWWESYYSSGTVYFYMFWLGLVLIADNVILFLYVGNSEMHVTNFRVYGKTAFGKRVDLPIDSVSAVGMHFPKAVSVGTSSGKISFILLENQEAVHKAISQLLIERQKKSEQAGNSPAASNAEELKKFKELLDSGVISQQEFDAKKKQLLGL